MSAPVAISKSERSPILTEEDQPTSLDRTTTTLPFENTPTPQDGLHLIETGGVNRNSIQGTSEGIDNVDFVDTPTSNAGTKTAVLHLTPEEIGRIDPTAFASFMQTRPYSKEVYYMGVQLVKEAQWLGFDSTGKYNILYQQTGGSMFANPRHFMLGFYIDGQPTATHAKVSWKLLDNYNTSTSSFEGEAAQELTNRGINPPRKAVWTPYNSGSWELDLVAGTLTYSVQTDPGGALNFSIDGAVVKYPNHIANDLLGLSGSFEVQ